MREREEVREGEGERGRGRGRGEMLNQQIFLCVPRDGRHRGKFGSRSACHGLHARRGACWHRWGRRRPFEHKTRQDTTPQSKEIMPFFKLFIFFSFNFFISLWYDQTDAGGFGDVGKENFSSQQLQHSQSKC